MKVIKFEMPNCIPCANVSRYLESKGVEYERVVASDDPDKASEYMVMAVPVVVLLDDNGAVLNRITGYKPEELDKLIQQLN